MKEKILLVAAALLALVAQPVLACGDQACKDAECQKKTSHKTGAAAPKKTAVKKDALAAKPTEKPIATVK